MGKFKSKKASSSTGRPSGSHSTLTDEGKKEYSREAARKSRTKARDQDPSLDAPSGSGLVTDLPKTPNKRGRPPLKDSAMTPRTLRKHKKDSISAKRSLVSEALSVERKAAELSETRRQAIRKRWDMRVSLSGEPENVSTSSDDEDDMQPLEVEGDTEKSDVQNTDRTRRRAICELVGVLPSNVFDSSKLFLRVYRGLLAPNIKISNDYLDSSGNMSFNQLKFSQSKISKLFKKRAAFESELFKHWLHVLLQHPVIETLFDSLEITLPEEIIPKSLILARKSRDITSNILSTSSRTKHSAKHLSIELAINLAKEGNLNSRHRGDITLLSDTLSCTWSYAKRVLVAIENETEADLYRTSVRCSSIHASHWPTELTKFVLLPENSRAVPGQESVSIRYGVRHAKYILLKSRKDIANRFKELNPECKFSVSTLMREFPQYAVTPTSRDLERNTCPYHANARRLIKVINRKLQQHKIEQFPTSCRAFILSTLCKSPLSTIEPLTWNVDCVTGECHNCPGLRLSSLKANAMKEEVNFSQWASKKQKVIIKGSSTEKYVFSLYTEKTSLKEAIQRLREMSSSLALHIFTAAKQWEAHSVLRSNLDIDSIISIEDYQKNLEAIYSENPTSMAYSGNKVTVALYPICVEYLGTDGILKKAAIAFLTDDKVHDHQQARDFEGRMFEIIREKLQRPILNWKRLTDGCDGQFRSGFTLADLMKACERFQLQRASFDFFEAHEGKNVSDTIGSIVKCAFVRAMHKNEQGVHNASDIVDVIRSELKEETKKFEFFVVEEFGKTDRIKGRDKCSVQGIMKLHSMVTNGSDVILRQWTCTKCTVASVCEECRESSNIVSLGNVILGTEDDSILAENIELQDSEDEGQTDNEEEEDSDVPEEDDDISPGDVVWGLCGRIWYPAKVCSLLDLPEDMQNSFRNSQQKLILKWYGENNFSLVRASKVEQLAENKVDAQRASRSAKMQILYNTALEDLLD